MKKNSIPIFVHHETGQKSQKGGEIHQAYLKYCIDKALKYGNQVILFGDKYNKDWCKKWVNVKQLPTKRWEIFDKYFVNYSYYPDAWAKGIFRRFFLFEEYLKNKPYDRFVLLDSDILLYKNVCTLTEFLDYDVAVSIPKDQDFKQLPKGNGLKMTANAGISFWTRKSLSEFLDFCIDTYQNNKSILSKKWQVHQKYHIAGGICEMTLIYLWIEYSKHVRVLNLLLPDKSGIIYNHILLGEENYLEKEFVQDSILQSKKVYFKEQSPYFMRKDGSLVQTYNLHFVGDSKRLMQDYSLFEKIRFHKKCIEFIWYLRSIVAKIVKNVIYK